MSKFAKIPTDTAEKLQLNAGVFVSSFDPEQTTPFAVTDIICATNGGASFSAVPAFSDFGEDIDNAPKNTMELKRQDDVEVKMSGTALTLDSDMAVRLAAAADAAAVTGTTGLTKITPRKSLKDADFEDLWWVGDYGDTDGDFIAIHLINGLSTGGFQLQTTDKGKGQFAFEITGHYSLDDPDTIPYELYIYQAPAPVPPGP